MPRHGTVPQLSELGEELRARAVSGPLPARLQSAPKFRELLALPAVVGLAGDDDPYLRALAFERVLGEVVRNLDRTFRSRRGESPSEIARGLYQLEGDWPREITKRRERIATKYGWDPDDFRQRYEKELHEHVAARLRTHEVAAPTAVSPPEPQTAEDWLKGEASAMWGLYRQLDEGLHQPPMHDAEPHVTSPSILYRWADVFHTAAEECEPPRSDEERSAVEDAGLLLGALATRGPFNRRDLDRLKREVGEARGSEDRQAVDAFYDFVEDTRRGQLLLRLLNAWLERCRCGLHPAKPSNERAFVCDVHSVLAQLEDYLVKADSFFVPGWRARRENPLMIEHWEAESRHWRESD